MKPVPPSPTPLPAIWVPPDPGYIKINIDAAIPENSSFFRIGMIARDDRGVTKWWARKEIQGRPTPTECEAMAALFGVQMAVRHKWRKVIVETDCLPVHGYLAKQQSGLVSYGAILDACYDLRSHFTCLSFTFVRRSGNSEAHAIVTATSLLCNEGSFFPSSLMK